MMNRRTLLGSAGAMPIIWTQTFSPAFAETPKDTIVMAHQIDDIISLDPQESFEFSGNEITGNVYEKLISPDTKDPTVIKPELAESWETLEGRADDDLQDQAGAQVRFGQPSHGGGRGLHADARRRHEQGAGLHHQPVRLHEGQCGDDHHGAGCEHRGAEDRLRPVADLPALLPVGQCRRDRRQKDGDGQGCSDDWGNAWLKQNSAGSGAWSVRAWRASESVTLEANPNNPAPPSVKRLIIRHVADPSVQLLLLQKGDIDIARTLAPEQIKTLEGNPAFTKVSASKASVNYLAMNQKHPMLAKPQVRQAIKWAIDYKTIATNITPTVYEVHQAFLPKGFPAALTDQPFQKNVEKAKALMKEAGAEAGFEITLDHQSTAPFNDVAQALQADLGAIGIKVKLQAAEFRQVLTKPGHASTSWRCCAGVRTTWTRTATPRRSA